MPSCHLKMLPTQKLIGAAAIAVEHNPANRPSEEVLQVYTDEVLHPQHIALLTSRYWGAKGVKLGVSFLDSPDQATRKLLLEHMNAWSQWANVQFQESASGGEVRIARADDGYWSYLGTDILSISAGEATMNLQGFTTSTPLSEYKRVVRHETGHTLGFPHEHMRREIVARIDPDKAKAYFLEYDGWDAQTVEDQVLTPLDESTLLDTPADVTSIMCYDLPASIMKDSTAVPGGMDIDPSDGGFAAKIYPKLGGPGGPGGGGGGGVDPAEIKARLDVVFAAVRNIIVTTWSSRSQRAALTVLDALRQRVDAILDGYIKGGKLPPSAAPVRGYRGGHVPPAVIMIVDAAVKTLEEDPRLVPYAPYIEEVRHLLDLLLPLA